MVAVTVQVYVVPFVRPITTMGDVLLLPEKAPALHVAVKVEIALPPLLAGGVKAMDACVSPGVAVPMVGAPGNVPAMAKL